MCRLPLTFALVDAEIQLFLMNKWDPVFQYKCTVFLLGTVWIMACRDRNLEFYSSFLCIFELFNICNFGGKENFSFCQFCKSKLNHE